MQAGAFHQPEPSLREILCDPVHDVRRNARQYRIDASEFADMPHDRGVEPDPGLSAAADRLGHGQTVLAVGMGTTAPPMPEANDRRR